MTREDILARYRHLRAIAMRHNSAALGFVSRQAVLVSMAVRKRVNLARGKKLAQTLPELQPLFAIQRSLAQGWVADPCQRRQPPKAGAEGQR